MSTNDINRGSDAHAGIVLGANSSTTDQASFALWFFSALTDMRGVLCGCFDPIPSLDTDLRDGGYVEFDRNGENLAALQVPPGATGTIDTRAMTALPSVLRNLRELRLGDCHITGLDVAGFFKPGGLPEQLEVLVVRPDVLASACSVAIDGETHSLRNLPRSLKHIDFRFANLAGQADLSSDDFPPRLATLRLAGNPRLKLAGSIIHCAPFVTETLLAFDVDGADRPLVHLSEIHVTDVAGFVALARHYKRGALSADAVRDMMSSSVVGDDGTSASSLRWFVRGAWDALQLQHSASTQRNLIWVEWLDTL
jgi:hypothetical protein